MKKFFTIIALMFIVGGATAGNNANLITINVVGGTLVPMFNPNITDYTLPVPYMVTNITLLGIAEDFEATVEGNVNNVPINVGANLFTITVTATDGITKKYYHVNVVRSGDGAGANLASLTVDPGNLSPAFSPNTLVYTVNVANTVTMMNHITGVAADPLATVTGNVVNAPLNVGSNIFVITVTAADGVTTKSYYVNVFRVGDGSNANLINIIVSTGTFSPAFNPNITSYTLNVMYIADKITLWGVPEDPLATVAGNVLSAPINVGSNMFTLTVTAANGVTTKSYYVNVIRAAVDPNANLASLTVTPGNLSPDFSPNITNYTVNVAHSATTVTIKGVAQSPYATVTGNVTNAPLNVGSNNFTVTVTAENNAVKKYNVIVIRAATPQFTIVANVEGNIGGSISPKGSVPAAQGDNITFTMTPDYGYYIYYVFVDGVNVGTEKTYTFKNITDNHTIVVKFDKYLEDTYTITAGVLGNIGGTITPSGIITVTKDATATFEMIADDNYTIQYVIVDSEDVGTANIYTFKNVTANHTIYVAFGPVTGIDDDVETLHTTSVRVYPNPTDGQLRIMNYELRIDNVEIFDVFGKNVSRLTSHIAHPISIDISHLPSGIYFLRITTETGVITKKIIKK